MEKKRLDLVYLNRVFSRTKLVSTVGVGMVSSSAHELKTMSSVRASSIIKLILSDSNNTQ